jgi:uncharacterized protein involved in outer membrane biogenesis
MLIDQLVVHVQEMVLRKITGAQLIESRCDVADFNVEHGVMKVGALLLDTDVTKIAGTGSVDLANETLSLTLIPRPKRLSLLALRGPIYVRGDLAHPDVAVDADRMGARGLAALALGAISPALSLLALADPGSREDSECNALTERVQAPWSKTTSAEKHLPV